MYQRAFAVMANEANFPGLWALLNSIAAYHGQALRVYVFLHGAISAHRRNRLAEHSLGHAITVVDTEAFQPRPAGYGAAKQQIFDYLMGKVRSVCMVNTDLVLLSTLDDVFEQAESGRIVSCRDGDAETVSEGYAVYSPEIVGTLQAHFSTKFLCLDLGRHWDLAAPWSFAARFAEYSVSNGNSFKLPGRSDQDVLHAIAALQGKGDVLLADESNAWCSFGSGLRRSDSVKIIERPGLQLIVENCDTGQRQRLLHCAGPKWWTSEGQQHFAEWKDFLGCFHYFAASPSPFG